MAKYPSQTGMMASITAEAEKDRKIMTLSKNNANVRNKAMREANGNYRYILIIDNNAITAKRPGDAPKLMTDDTQVYIRNYAEVSLDDAIADIQAMHKLSDFSINTDTITDAKVLGRLELECNGKLKKKPRKKRLKTRYA